MRSSNGTFNPLIEALRPVKRARMIHQDPPHHLGCNAVKMCSALPRHSLLSDEPHVRFVNEGGRLKGMVGSFAAQVGSRATSQFLVNQRHEVVPGLEVALGPKPAASRSQCHPFFFFFRRRHDAVSSDLAR